jgi:hypothetical protein
MATVHGSPVTSTRSDPQQQRAILVIISHLPFYGRAKYGMRLQELLVGYPIRETDLGQTNPDDPGLGSSTPLATMAAPGISPVDQEFTLPGLKPLRRLRPLRRSALAGSDSARP